MSDKELFLWSIDQYIEFSSHPFSKKKIGKWGIRDIFSRKKTLFALKLQNQSSVAAASNFELMKVFFSLILSFNFNNYGLKPP